jgi:hypothetical protein
VRELHTLRPELARERLHRATQSELRAAKASQPPSAIACPPPLAISRGRSSMKVDRRAARPTAKPPRAKRRASDAPRPRPTPVIRGTRF